MVAELIAYLVDADGKLIGPFKHDVVGRVPYVDVAWNVDHTTTITGSVVFGGTEVMASRLNAEACVLAGDTVVMRVTIDW